MTINTTSAPTTRRPRAWIGVMAAAVLAVTTILVGAPSQPAYAIEDPVLGAYSGELLQAPGVDNVRHIDVSGTISQLTYANANTFAYLIYGYGAANAATGSARDTTADNVTQAQWNDLPAFLSAAGTAGIEVWVYLVPPSESHAGGISNYAPFYWDYVTWGDEIGQLAATHTNLTAIVIDDFGGNTVEGGSVWTFKFSQTNVAAMRAAAKSHASWIQILPAMYYCQFHGNGAIASLYRTVVDGYVGAYNGSPSCTWWSGDGTPVPNTTDATLADIHFRVESGLSRCMNAGCIEFGVPWGVPTSTGGWTRATQTISVNPSGPYSLSFWTNDDYIGGSPGGYHKLQVLVDGVVVWQEDVATWMDWHQSTVNLTTALAGKTTATLELRLYEQAGVGNFHVSGWFDSLTSQGFSVTNAGFDTTLSGWTGAESHALFVQRWVPTMSFVAMVYAARLADVEPNPTTSAYTIDVSETALDLFDQGRLDGLLLYNMNMTGVANGLGDPTTIDDISALYGTY